MGSHLKGRFFYNLPSFHNLSPSNTLSFLSPAKINLFFSVIAKRVDGYHEIASLYQAINLFDTLTFSLADRDHFSTDHPSLAMDDQNLVCKALTLFRKETGFTHPLFLHLSKKIPLQSGLGGGSSNAATTLFALNQLAGSPLTLKQLSDLGASLGSDVPFFFSLGTAYCTGRGEKVKDISLPFAFLGFLKTSSFGLSTPKVYQNIQKEDLSSFDGETLLAGFLQNSPQYINDLEKSAFFLEPRLLAIKTSLLKMGFEAVSMTGSGTAFFCVGQPPFLSFPEGIAIQNMQRNPHSWYGS